MEITIIFVKGYRYDVYGAIKVKKSLTVNWEIVTDISTLLGIK